MTHLPTTVVASGLNFSSRALVAASDISRLSTFSRPGAPLSTFCGAPLSTFCGAPLSTFVGVLTLEAGALSLDNAAVDAAADEAAAKVAMEEIVLDARAVLEPSEPVSEGTCGSGEASAAEAARDPTEEVEEAVTGTEDVGVVVVVALPDAEKEENLNPDDV